MKEEDLDAAYYMEKEQLDYKNSTTDTLERMLSAREEADFDVFFKELERELKLRIPDKFLKAHRWR